MSHVIRHSRAEGTTYIVLLMLADRADSEQWQCWPSLDMLARDARVHRATVARCLNELDSDCLQCPDCGISHLGEIVRERGGGRGTPTRYWVLGGPVDNPGKQSHSATVSDFKQSQNGFKQSQNRPINSRTGATRTISEPSIEPRAGFYAVPAGSAPPTADPAAGAAEWEPRAPEELAATLAPIRAQLRPNRRRR